jgi:hypothetical protein
MFLTTLSDYFDKFRQSRFGRKYLDIFYETAVLVAYIGAIALIHLVEEKWIGKDALFFGKTKIGYIIDVGHLLAIGLFFLEIVKDVVEVFRDITDIVVKSIVQALRDLMSLFQKQRDPST